MSMPKFDERDAGVLLVYSDAGKAATEEEFHGEKKVFIILTRIKELTIASAFLQIGTTMNMFRFEQVIFRNS